MVVCISATCIARSSATGRSLPTARWERGLKLRLLLPRRYPPLLSCKRNLSSKMRPRRRSGSNRYREGALNLETSEVRPVVLNQQVVDVVKQEKNRATELIEDFMIAVNGVVARMLEKVSSLRRIVKTPERWDRIVQLAATQGGQLPAQPASKALNNFLLKRKAADPDHFADLSLA